MPPLLTTTIKVMFIGFPVHITYSEVRFSHTCAYFNTIKSVHFMKQKFAIFVAICPAVYAVLCAAEYTKFNY